MSIPTTIGTDGPAPPATHGYSLNHFALLAADMVKMRHFYGTVLGMRHIVTHEVSPTYHVTYMGYPAGGEHQSGAEMLRQLRHRDGLLEFLHPSNFKGNSSSSSSSSSSNDHGRVGRFSHMGVAVPDVQAAERRMKEFGVPILKGLGEDSIEPGSSVAEWWGLDDAHAIAAAAGIRAMNFKDMLLVLDPEGNVVELQQRN